MIEREREAEFVAWLRPRVEELTGVAADCVAGAPMRPRVSAMREAGGVDYRQAEAQSVAFQVEFDDIETARRWSREQFATVAADFEEKFGPQAMVFVSIFEEL